LQAHLSRFVGRYNKGLDAIEVIFEVAKGLRPYFRCNFYVSNIVTYFPSELATQPKNATIRLQKSAPQRHIIKNDAIQTSLDTYFSYVKAFYKYCIAVASSYWPTWVGRTSLMLSRVPLLELKSPLDIEQRHALESYQNGSAC
jgi:hypothetical protein